MLIKIFIAYILDLIFGDPYRVPHPITFIGKLVKNFEKKLYDLKNKKIAGIILNISVLIIVYIFCYFFAKVKILEIYFLYTIFATKSLVKESKKVYNALISGDIEDARLKLSYLVSRDTKELTEEEIIKGTLETCSENITDGITAPLFYMFIGGLPLAMTYKAINTMDSMLGYKTGKYIEFGWFSAKLDDFVNLVPARLSGLIFVPFSALLLGLNFKNSLKIFLRDRYNHSSPNSAHTESALAGALGIALGGPTKYFGEMENKKFIGDKLRDFTINDIVLTHKIIYLSGFIALLFYSVTYVIVYSQLFGAVN